MTDAINAFVPGPRITIEGARNGPPAGLTFAAKDLFAVAGHPTGGGNHDWARANPVPPSHAWAVQTLLDAGVKDGVYTVSTTVLSQTDGHVTDNAFVFAVGEAVFPANITRILPKNLLFISLKRWPDFQHSWDK